MLGCWSYHWLAASYKWRMCDHKFFTNRRKKSLWDDQYVNFCQIAHQWHGKCAIEWCITGGKSVAFSKPTSIHANPQSLLTEGAKWPMRRDGDNWLLGFLLLHVHYFFAFTLVQITNVTCERTLLPSRYYTL